MSIAEAADYYLATVCPSNATRNAYNAATAAYDAAEEPDFATLPPVAAAARDAARTAADRFDDEAVLWPSKLVDDIGIIRDSYFSDVSGFSQLADSSSIEAWVAVTWPANDEASASAQRVRSRLNLPVDTDAGCADYLG